jgi:hypothetical protein
MRNLMTLMLVLLLGACGGGGGQGDSPVAGSSGPTLRFEGVYTGGTLVIHPVAGAATIGSNALARVDVLVTDRSTLSLAAATRVDATGRNEYVFNVPTIAGDAGRMCSAYMPLRITVTDVGGFSFSKYTAVCPSGSSTFTGLSDYGEHDMHITASSSVPMNSRAQRYQEVGDYRDDVLHRLATSLDVVLRSNERDSLTASVGSFGLSPEAAPSVPAGSTMTMRVDAGGGAFAEAAGITTADPLGYGQSADVSLACCHAVGDGSAKQVRVLITGARSGTPATFAYAWRITDPATGTVVSQESATRVGVPYGPDGGTLARLEEVLDVRSGQQVELTATTDDPQTRVDARVLAGATTGLTLGSAASNNQARMSVFCCSLYAVP